MFASQDMVYRRDDGEVQSGGMKVNSILLKNGHPLGYGKKGGTVDKMLGDLIVPVGLIYLQEHLDKRVNRDYPMQLNSEPITDTLYDKLLGIDNAQTKKPAKKTRRSKKHNKKTRKN